MNTYVALLRGINVGPHKRIKMDLLRHNFEQLGLAEVQSYIQSGNIIFRAKERSIRALEKQIHQQVLQNIGHEVSVFVLELTQLQAIVRNNPYANHSDIARLHLTILSDIPTLENQNNIIIQNYLPDEYAIRDRFIYLYCANSYSKTKLLNAFFENKLKLSASTRNWKTILALLKMASKVHT